MSGQPLLRLPQQLSHLSFRVALTVKNPTAMQESWTQSLGGEDPLEEEMTAHSSIPAWRITWTGEPGGLQSLESQGVRHD